MAGHAEMRERANHRLFEPVHIFLDVATRALQVHHRIGHHLPGAVVSDLPAAVALHHRDVAGRKHMRGLTREPLGEHRRVLAQPQGVGRAGIALCGELAHRLEGGRVVHASQQAQFHGAVLPAAAYSTTLTIGWVDSVR